jgi:hypothetical protein
MGKACRDRADLAAPDAGFRVEAWERGASAFALVMVPGVAGAVAAMLMHDGTSGEWFEGRGLLDRSDLHAAREAVVDALPRTPAGRGAAARFGLHAGFGELVRFVHETLSSDLGGPPGSVLPTLSASLSASARNPASALGYETLVREGGEDALPRVRLEPGSREPGTTALRALPRNALLNARLGMYPSTGPDLDAVFGGMRDVLVGRLDARAASVLCDRHWTPRAETFYADGGRDGFRRRQAAALYPCLAPAFAHHARIADLIDAGRPYEAEAAGLLSTLLPAGPPLGVSGLRRLRTLTGDVTFGTLVEVLSLARALPLDWLPTASPGWDRLIELHRGMGLGRYAEALGLDPRDLLRDVVRWWRDPGDGDGFEPAAWLAGLEDARDMARRAAETLVEPLLRMPPGTEAIRIAGRLLFRGLASGGVVARSRAWHEDMPRFDRIVPGETPGLRWPAIFPRFDAGDGVWIEALTSPDALASEGARGRDGAGARGLEHCVGGYARDCWLGRAHVASIRREGRGPYERLSTVELVHGVGGLAVRQHRGGRNAPPPEAAVRALDALLAAVRDGSVVLDPLALHVRRGGGGVERTTPEALADAARAWAPHLPRSAPRTDAPALAAWIASRGREAVKYPT